MGKAKSPKALKGSHMTFTIHSDGRRELKLDKYVLAVNKLQLDDLKKTSKKKAKK